MRSKLCIRRWSSLLLLLAFSSCGTVSTSEGVKVDVGKLEALVVEEFAHAKLAAGEDGIIEGAEWATFWAILAARVLERLKQ